MTDTSVLSFSLPASTPLSWEENALSSLDVGSVVWQGSLTDSDAILVAQKPLAGIIFILLLLYALATSTASFLWVATIPSAWPPEMNQDWSILQFETKVLGWTSLQQLVSRCPKEDLSLAEQGIVTQQNQNPQQP